MYWQIDGADRVTGEERTVFVEAGKESEALKSQAAFTLYVTRCCPLSGKPPAPEKTPAAPVKPAIPSYQAILSGSKLLHTFGSFCLLGGLGAFLVAVFLFFRAFVEFRESHEVGHSARTGLLNSATLTMIGGIIAVIFSVVLQWLAGIGIALRDMARNSFRQIEISQFIASSPMGNTQHHPGTIFDAETAQPTAVGV